SRRGRLHPARPLDRPRRPGSPGYQAPTPVQSPVAPLGRSSGPGRACRADLQRRDERPLARRLPVRTLARRLRIPCGRQSGPSARPLAARGRLAGLSCRAAEPSLATTTTQRLAVAGAPGRSGYLAACGHRRLAAANLARTAPPTAGAPAAWPRRPLGGMRAVVPGGGFLA